MGARKNISSSHLPVSAWNFQPCLKAEESKACYLFEFALECPEVIEEVEANRAKIADRQNALPQYQEWIRLNPMPQMQSQEFKAWEEAAKRACPLAVITTRLAVNLHFLLDCEAFPRKHWLDIREETRVQIARNVRKTLTFTEDDSDLAERELAIWDFDSFVTCSFGRLNVAFTRRYRFPEFSGEHVFSWNWARSDRKLLEDFKRWLKNNRPGGQPALENSPASQSRKTSPREHLNALAALRVLRAFGRNFQEARMHTIKFLEKPPYKEDSAWIKAEKKALKEVDSFRRGAFRELSAS